MHIVHLIARLNDGGPARVVANLCRAIGARGHRMTVLAGVADKDEPDLSVRMRADGIDVRVIHRLSRRLSATGDLIALAQVMRHLRVLRPDVVHTHTAKAGVLGRLACRALGLPCLHTYHGHVLDGYFGAFGNFLARSTERLVAGAAWHHALTATQFVELHHRFHIGRRRRWRILPPPVAPVAKQPPAWQAQLSGDRAVIGFLGRLAPVKDGRLFLETLARVNELRPIEGLVCGDGSERRALELRAEALGVPVLFTGYVPAGEAFAAMDVLMLTSRNEGLPLVAVEAGGCGIPVIAPAVGGLRDLGRWGAIESAERTPEALAQACLRVLDDRHLRQERLQRARAMADALRPDALARQYESLYTHVAHA